MQDWLRGEKHLKSVEGRIEFPEVPGALVFGGVMFTDALLKSDIQID
jgi:hypothetical protein